MAGDGSVTRRDSTVGSKEQRAAHRRELNPPAKVVLLVVPDSRMVDAMLLDLSASGVGLRMPSPPLPPGTQFTMQLPALVDVQTPLRYRVVRCRPLGRGEFHIGAASCRGSQNRDPQLSSTHSLSAHARFGERRVGKTPHRAAFSCLASPKEATRPSAHGGFAIHELAEHADQVADRHLPFLVIPVTPSSRAVATSPACRTRGTPPGLE